MNTRLTYRFWTEFVLGILTGILAILTAVWPAWIETVTRTDPDAGSGAVEWVIVSVLLAATAVLAFSAQRNWRRVRLSRLAPRPGRTTSPGGLRYNAPRRAEGRGDIPCRP